MAQRYDYYFRQPVGEDELDEGFTGLEQADYNFVIDNLGSGVVNGGVVSERGAGANLSVDVSGPAVVHDQVGQRTSWPSTQNVDVSVDSSSVSTAVAGAGNSKIISVFAKFKRLLSDPRTDGNDATVFYDRAESFEFIVRQSAEHVTPTPPALESDSILLADMTRAFGQTTIINANLDTSRRQEMFITAGSPFSIARGTIQEVVDDIVARYNGHIVGTDTHAAADVDFTGPATWYGAENLTSTDVEAAIIEIAADLAATASTGGAGRVGCGSFAARTWAGGDAMPAGPFSIWGAIDAILVDLRAQDPSDEGADRIGANGSGDWIWTTVRDQLDQLSSNSAPMQFLFGNTDVSSAASQYFIDPGGLDRLTTFNEGKIEVTSKVLIRRLRVRCRVAFTGTGGGVDVTVRKNGVDTALTANLAIGATSASDLVNSVIVTAGQDLSVGSVPQAGTTGQAKDFYVTFEGVLDFQNMP